MDLLLFVLNQNGLEDELTSVLFPKLAMAGFIVSLLFFIRYKNIQSEQKRDKHLN